MIGTRTSTGPSLSYPQVTEDYLGARYLVRGLRPGRIRISQRISCLASCGVWKMIMNQRLTSCTLVSETTNAGQTTGRIVARLTRSCWPRRNSSTANTMHGETTRKRVRLTQLLYDPPTSCRRTAGPRRRPATATGPRARPAACRGRSRRGSIGRR